MYITSHQETEKRDNLQNKAPKYKEYTNVAAFQPITLEFPGRCETYKYTTLAKAAAAFQPCQQMSKEIWMIPYPSVAQYLDSLKRQYSIN